MSEKGHPTAWLKVPEKYKLLYPAVFSASEMLKAFVIFELLGSIYDAKTFKKHYKWWTVVIPFISFHLLDSLLSANVFSGCNAIVAPVAKNLLRGLVTFRSQGNGSISRVVVFFLIS